MARPRCLPLSLSSPLVSSLGRVRPPALSAPHPSAPLPIQLPAHMPGKAAGASARAWAPAREGGLGECPGLWSGPATAAWE